MSTWRSNVSLVDETASVLRERIFSGRLPPGEQLPQAELSVELGVSRTPLREALRILEREGIVRTDAQHTARVAVAERNELIQALEFRDALDGTAARLACGRISAVVLAELDRLLADQARALEPWHEAAFRRSGADFHDRLLHAAGNVHLDRQRTFVRLTEQVLRPLGELTRAEAHESLEEHITIAAALRAGDAAGAEACARAHIRADIGRLTSPEGATP